MAEMLAWVVDRSPPPSAFGALRQSRLHGHPRRPAVGDAPPDLRRDMARCAEVLDAHEDVEVIAHLDWREQNLGWRGGEICAIYDWDSVVIGPEAAAVGAAAGMFTYDFRDPVPHVPTPDEVIAFVSDYVTHRRVSLRAVCAAAGVKMLGYAALEHASDPQGLRLGPRSYRSALRASPAQYRAVLLPE